MPISLLELARAIGAELRGASDADSHRLIHRCTSLEAAGPDDVSFLANAKYAAQLASTHAAAVIVAPGAERPGRPILVAADPYFAFRNAVVALHGFRKHPQPEGGPISPRAVIHPAAALGPGTIVHPFAVVEAGAVVGPNCVIYPGVFIGPRARIGEGCLLYPNVAVYDDCVLGNRVTLHAGCVIGQDGFGYATHKGAHHKIPQVGNVVVEDDVEMGANCAIDRATVGSTVIGQGTKFSDAVTIGHGCKVGRHNLYVALVGLAGSVETGDYVVIGGQSGIAGHLKIGHQVQIAASSGVMSDIPDKQQWGGTPAMPLTEAKRIYLHGLRVPELMDRVKKLERQLAKLQSPSPSADHPE